MSPERDVPVAKGRSLYHFMSLVMYLHYLYLSLPPSSALPGRYSPISLLS
jgi:hypothetical protein